MTTQNIQVVNQAALYANNGLLSYASATTLTVASCQFRDSSNKYDIILSSSLTVNSALSGVNGLDTGTIANSTWYAVHVIGDSRNYNTGKTLLSTSATAPVLPSGYDVFRRIGWVLTNGSAQFLKFYEAGNGNLRYVQWDTPISVLSGGTQTSFTAVSLATAMPLQATPVYFNSVYTPNSATNTAQLRPTGSSVAANSAPIIIGGGVAAAQKSSAIKVLPQLATGNPSVDYLVQTSDTLSLSVMAYEDFI